MMVTMMTLALEVAAALAKAILYWLCFSASKSASLYGIAIVNATKRSESAGASVDLDVAEDTGD